ncbi:uncharacterized protein LOC120902004 isoform X1 [Anopheles arabiensis]|uniref:uncharacterized protein LOC120902004 isoform X1 n=1 Tax=Anopheles arabiensis TaxID=7173 RepID=UPI001AAC8E56|nr:uncharacterized protein LOC120902004 isoform X1 [Anopheles arabiensis]
MMRKLYTISKMIQYEHTWIVEPSAFEAHCPRCEVLTGATKWELNCCTDGVQSAGDYAYCSKCDGPYVKLLSDESQGVIIAVHEVGMGRRVFLERDTYTLEPADKLSLMVKGSQHPSYEARLK